MKIIGVAGTSGAGKTTLCSIFKEEYGAYIIDADEVAKELSQKGTAYLQAICKQFGLNVVDENGELKRSELAHIIYEDTEKRNQLNALTFVYVVQEIRERINQLQGEKLVIMDAPLLFESKLDEICDFVIGMIAQEEEKIERICKRDRISKEIAQKRLKIQMDEREIQKRADYIIKNDGDKVLLKKELKKIEEKIIEKNK